VINELHDHPIDDNPLRRRHVDPPAIRRDEDRRVGGLSTHRP